MSLGVSAQEARSKVAVDVGAGHVLPTHTFILGENMSETPVRQSVFSHVKYGFHFRPETEFGRLFPNTYQGIGLSYQTFFNNEELGSPISLYVFQHSRLASFSERLSLDYEWNFGMATNWVPYDILRNPYNKLVSTKVTAYINAGVMLNWSMARNWNLTAGVGLTHYSNGNTSFPNYGINDLGFRTSVIRSFGPERAENPAPSKSTETFERHWTYDFVLYGAWRSKTFIYKGKRYIFPDAFGVFALNVNPLYNINKSLRVGPSLDLMVDNSANIQDHLTNLNRFLYRTPPFDERFHAGISARAELVRPIFSANFGVGATVLGKGEDSPGKMYYILALKTSLSEKLFLHVGCQFYSFDNPRCLMLGFGYRLNKNK